MKKVLLVVPHRSARIENRPRNGESRKNRPPNQGALRPRGNSMNGFLMVGA